MAVIAYPYFPKQLANPYPPLVQDLIALKHSGHHECILQMIRMVADLKIHGTDSRFFKGLGGPLVELKSRSRGGDKGGARIYLFRGLNDTFFLCRAECKHEALADAILLADTAEIASAYRNGLPIFPDREWRGRERTQDEKTS
jgi:hypothetical protein